MFEVVTPAGDLNLLTVEELRVAIGLESDDGSQDEKLEALGNRVSSMIASACQVVKDGVNPPTLLLEGCVDIFRLKCSQRAIFLSRKPIYQIVSVTSAGSSLSEDVDFEVDKASGKLIRLCDDSETCWEAGKVIVEYDAGFDRVPEDLKAIAVQLAGGYWADDGVDPMEKRLSIPGIVDIERWVDATADPQMPSDIMKALIDGGYVNRVMVF